MLTSLMDAARFSLEGKGHDDTLLSVESAPVPALSETRVIVVEAERPLAVQALPLGTASVGRRVVSHGL